MLLHAGIGKAIAEIDVGGVGPPFPEPPKSFSGERVSPFVDSQYLKAGPLRKSGELLVGSVHVSLPSPGECDCRLVERNS
jgi:hypothetical protein